MGPGLEIHTFERLTLKGRRFFFHIIDVGNREILVSGQTYKTELQRNKTARRFGDVLGCHVVEKRH
jgi:hypothetical protein